MSSGTLLSVDDDAHDRELIQIVMGEVAPHVRVESCASVVDATAWLHRWDADKNPGEDRLVILCDLKMPGDPGLALAEYLRTTPELRTIPAVAFSSSTHRQDIYDAYAAGFFGYLEKPVSLADFRRVLGEFTTYWFETMLIRARSR